MAMLRVSSYRRLFEEERWGRGNGAALLCGGQYRASARGGAVDRQYEEPDFEGARIVNREAVSRFVRERALIAALNDRLAFLIETARCLEEDNESLEAQILDLEGRPGGLDTCITAVPDCSLEGVVESLRREKEQILCDMEELQKELAQLQARHEDAIEQGTLVRLEREDVAVDVDELTAECLALRDQEAIYEQQLDRMQEEHQTRVEALVEPCDDEAAVVTIEFPTPDITPAILDIKEYYSELADSLQFESMAAAAVALRDQKLCEGAVVLGGKSKVTDVDELRNLVAELQKELAELKKCSEDLEKDIEDRKEDHLDEIEELECHVADLEDALVELDAQMREQCGDYDELLRQKMSLDIEIKAYRGLVEEEDERLCYQ